jgi:hypothetical protein
MRPFLSTLWASLSPSNSDDRGTAASSFPAFPRSNKRLPGNLVHTSRAYHGLVWFRAFFQQQRGTLTRAFNFDPASIPELVICTDACPWGIGGFVLGPQGPEKWFSDTLCTADEQTFGLTIGEAAGTTTWEAMAVLVAVRVLRPRSGRVRIRLRSDSLSTLFAVSSMKAKAPGLSLIMAELALERAELEVDISECVHIPGVANTIADALSRLSAPDAKRLPSELDPRLQVPVPQRDDRFWTSRLRART